MFGDTVKISKLKILKYIYIFFVLCCIEIISKYLSMLCCFICQKGGVKVAYALCRHTYLCNAYILNKVSHSNEFNNWHCDKCVFCGIADIFMSIYIAFFLECLMVCFMAKLCLMSSMQLHALKLLTKLFCNEFFVLLMLIST